MSVTIVVKVNAESDDDYDSDNESLAITIAFAFAHRRGNDHFSTPWHALPAGPLLTKKPVFRQQIRLSRNIKPSF